MNIVKVTARTVLQTDYAANIDKFYTTYAAGEYEVRQWGRVGVIGQFSIEKHPSPAAAESSARQQMTAKVRKGYTDGQDQVEFQFDLDKLGSNPSKDQAKMLAHVKDAAAQQSSVATAKAKTPMPSRGTTVVMPATVTTDRFEDFTSRALNAITLAVTDPAKAGVTYAKLNEEWVELQTITEKAQSYLSTLDQLVSASMS